MEVRGELVQKEWPPKPDLNAPVRFKKGCGYTAFVPFALSELNIQLPGEIARIISDAETTISALNRTAASGLMPLARLLLRTESIASSRVEGMQVDARTLARAEANQEAGRGIGTNAAEILANIDAMQLAIERASSVDRIRIQDVIDIHAELLRPAPNSRIAGRLRTSQNWIGGNIYNPCEADFVPPPPEEVHRLLEDLCDFSSAESLSVLTQASIAHVQFETIHPFEDGNGRTGRALIHVILRRRGLAPTLVPPISVILARNKEEYIRGLNLFREDRVSEWLGIFAKAASESATWASQYVTRVVQLQEEWREMLRNGSNPRSDAAAWVIIDVLPAHPVITVPVAAAATQRTKPAVGHGISELEEAGILRRLSESARNRAWEATGLLDLIVGLETGVQ